MMFFDFFYYKTPLAKERRKKVVERKLYDKTDLNSKIED